ncbi:MAG: response regulator [Desulfopila sp.]|jgi:CheY-like chemotaxis protein|nr:response regulator [Desulfopila sp.]
MVFFQPLPVMKKILYIEDDISLRQLVRFILDKREDLQMIEAETGSQGLQMAIEEQPDIILLDISLSDLNGYEVFSRLKKNDSVCKIPVIAVSGDSMPEDIEKGLQAGFSAYLTKPINIKDFYNLLDKTLYFGE